MHFPGYITPPRGKAEWDRVYGHPDGSQAWEREHLGFCSLAELREPRLMAVEQVDQNRAMFGLGPLPAGSLPEIRAAGVGHLYYPLGGQRIDFFATRHNPYTGGRGYGFACHKLLEGVFYELFRRWTLCGLMGHLATFNGSYVYRPTRGSRNLSPHAYGMAFDVDAQWNALGIPHERMRMHPELVAIAEGMGFTWGGRFRRSDGMHFQWGAYANG